MNFFNDRLSKLISTVTDMRESYITMSVNFKHLETSFDKFVDKTDKKLDKISLENEDIRRRLTSVEGSFDSIIKGSAKEALLNLAREKLNNTGQWPVNPEEIVKLMDKKNKEK